MQAEAERKRTKEQKIMKANLKEKAEVSSDEWESAEEDAPVVQLQELLGDMRIDGSDEESD